MICKQCANKIVETAREDHGDCVNVEYSCPVHGLQIIVSHSKRIYQRKSSYIDTKFEVPEIVDDDD